MFMKAYKSAVSILVKRPVILWGLSLLSGIICFFAGLLTAPFLGLIGAAFSLVVAAGMAKVYLDALDGKEINSDQLFAGFKRFWVVLGGIAWQALWIFIWIAGTLAVAGVVIAMFSAIGMAIRAAAVFNAIGGFLGAVIFIAGLVMVVIKTYSYSFVPYILMTREDVSATQALRLSKRLTRGKRGAMFVADLLFDVGVSAVAGLLAAFSAIPYVGAIFSIVLIAFVVVVALFSGIFKGLYKAAFYQMPEVTIGAADDFDARMEQFAQQFAEGPATPAAPAAPVVPEAPVAPEVPVVPEAPAAPEAPEAPQQPEAPQE